MAVDILGQTRNALMDTVSEVSILPVKVLQRALDDGIDIDTQVRELG